jgi:DNA-binding GntR family transcriptional regulator
MSASRSQQAYWQLHEKISSGELEPGSVVSEASLAKDLGLSRTPIGEALRRLAEEGIVEQVPRYGTIVREIPTSELAELFEIREALEGMAAGKAAEQMTPSSLEDIARLCDTIDHEIASAKAQHAKRLEDEALRRFLAADMAFHLVIIASAGNRRLLDMIQQTRSVSLMFKARRGEHSIERVQQAASAHRAILQALTQRNAEEATRLVVSHIRSSREQSLVERPREHNGVNLGTINLPHFVKQNLAELNL